MLEVMRDILQSRYLRSDVVHKQIARTSLIALALNTVDIIIIIIVNIYSLSDDGCIFDDF